MSSFKRSKGPDCIYESSGGPHLNELFNKIKHFHNNLESHKRSLYVPHVSRGSLDKSLPLQLFIEGQSTHTSVGVVQSVIVLLNYHLTTQENDANSRD